MTEVIRCESCGTRVESGPYCTHCVDANGGLCSFEETLERFIQVGLASQRASDRDDARRKALDYMARMPAWAEHPVVRDRVR